MLFLNAATGLPHFGKVVNPLGPASLDGMLWSSCIALMHAYAVYRLHLDDRPVSFPSPSIHEPLWRFFYRRSGVHRLEFRILLRDHAVLKEYRAGETVADNDGHRTCAHLLVKGVVENRSVADVAVAEGRGGTSSTTTPTTKTSVRYSGSMLSMHLFGVFGVKMGADFSDLTSVAKTSCTVLHFPLDGLVKMSTVPALASAWKNLILYQLASFSSANLYRDGVYLSSSGASEPPAFYEGLVTSLDFDEFTPSELALLKVRPPTGLVSSSSFFTTASSFFSPKSWATYLSKSFAPLLSSGVRHGQPTPLHAAAVRNDVLARSPARSSSAAAARTCSPLPEETLATNKSSFPKKGRVVVAGDDGDFERRPAPVDGSKDGASSRSDKKGRQPAASASLAGESADDDFL